MRNHSRLLTVSEFIDVNFIKNELKEFQNLELRILEIGCSAGIKLKEYQKFFNGEAIGVDPSRLSIREARKIHSSNKLDFVIADAGTLNMPSFSFDLVFFGFCLYLIDDEELLLSIREALRVLKRVVFLVITDFDVKSNIEVAYKHNNKLKTFKRNYVNLLSDFPNLHLVSKKATERMPILSNLTKTIDYVLWFFI